MTDPQLVELKRQTRIMAEKEAAKTAAGAVIVGFAAVAFFAVTWPHIKFPDWVIWAGPITLAVLAYIGTYHRHTRGNT